MKFNPQEFIRIAIRNGFSMEADGNRLMVCPSNHLTDEWRDTIRMHKPELLPYLPPHHGSFQDG